MRATDAAGNTDPTEAARSWTVDTEAPDTTIESGPAGTVSSNRADFELGSAEAGSTFECKLDDGAWESCGSPRTLTGLANGEHTFRARATDAAGNTDPSPASRTWVVDAEPPDTSITAGPSGTVRTTSATFTFAASEPGASFECRLDDGDWAPCGSPRTLTRPLATAAHGFHVRALDQLGNADASEASRTWVVERTPQKPTPPPVVDGPTPPATPAAPSQKLIAAQLERDLATTVRTAPPARRPQAARAARVHRRGRPGAHERRVLGQAHRARAGRRGRAGQGHARGERARAHMRSELKLTPLRRAQAGRRRPPPDQALARVP